MNTTFVDLIGQVEKILNGGPEGGERVSRILDESLMQKLWDGTPEAEGPEGAGEPQLRTRRTKFDDISRLVFLIADLKIHLSPALCRFLPANEQFRWKNLHKGIGVVDQIEVMMDYFLAGREAGAGTIEEAKTIIVRLAISGGLLPASSPTEQMAFFSEVDSLQDLSLVGTDFIEVNLLDPNLGGIEKFNTGFAPFDAPLGGFYQGLVGIMGEPGTGKTSLTMALAESCMRKGMDVWYFENEIPAAIMGGRFHSIISRNTMDDVRRLRLFCGPYGADKIVDMVRKDPNPNRVVIFDSPDVVFSGSGDSRRFDLEAAYQSFITIKPHSKFIVVTTQMGRKSGSMSLRSVAESWAKSWYVDIMLGLEVKGQHALTVKVLKNRFGVANILAYFAFNYANLTWNFNPDTLGQEVWEAAGGGEW